MEDNDENILTVYPNPTTGIVNINFGNHILIDTINFNHTLEYPKLLDLAKHVLDKDYSDKKSSYNLVLIKKCFMKLYDNYEKSILNSTAK